MRDIRFAAKIIGKFKSIQSAIFAVVTVLLLSAVLVITGVSMRYTRNSIFENSAVYTQNIVQQMNQNIDSYIDYMENIAYMISSNEDVQQYLFGENVDNGTRERLINQFKTILDGRSDIRNLETDQRRQTVCESGSEAFHPGVVSGSFTEAGRPASYIFSCTAHHQRRASVGDHFKQGDPSFYQQW